MRYGARIAVEEEAPRSARREILAGRYRLGTILGRGAHGVVYRAIDEASATPVAVKLIRATLEDFPEFSERLRREAEALRALKGTSAVVMHDFGEDGHGAVYLVMELLEGDTFDDHLFDLEDFGDRMSPYRLLVLLEPIARTLSWAHAAGIVHRDVKPGNIFLSHDDSVRLMDFGLAKLLHLHEITSSGMVAGSPSYIAPELWRAERADHRSDIYSLGAVVFRALAGRAPFVGQDLAALLTLVTTAPRPLLSHARPELVHLDAWCVRALATHGDQRFPDIGSFWGELLLAVQRGSGPSAERARQRFGRLSGSR